MEQKLKFTPNFDKEFTPISVVLSEYKKAVKNAENKKLNVCVERNDGLNYIYSINVFSDEEKKEENYAVIERLVKSILWVVGGYKIYIEGDDYIYERLKKAYSVGGERAFDVDFMQTVYEKPFEVIKSDKENFPSLKKTDVKIGGHLSGCRIGFDAGGSDRKVSAVVDGEVIYSEEVVWFPKINSDYHYHYEGIREAFKTAASKMPRVDAIGVSTAGVCINNKIMVSSLFREIPDEFKKEFVQPIYLNIAKEFNAPIEVANDGDVTALAGAIDLNSPCVLGIAMGTSEAVGYINDKGLLNGWLSEVAFVPVDFNKKAMVDEWSGDYGCGVKYFSQDGIIKLAVNAGIEFKEGLSPAEKLKVVQSLMEKGDKTAVKIYEDVGVYLGYAIPFYSEFYKINHLLLLGRVMSGEGGEIIIQKANEVLKSEFKEFSDIKLSTPSERNKRVGQSIAAASLAEIKS